MKILILHRVPYLKIEYHRGISHDLHDVTYFGTDAALTTLPPDLRCRRVIRPGTQSAFDEAVAWLAPEALEFDRVISMSEYELLDAARLREHLGTGGSPTAQVTLARDKYRMKTAVAAAGLRVPRFASLPDFVEQAGRVPWRSRTVLKPNLGASSEDVVVFDTPFHALDAVRGRHTGVSAVDANRNWHDMGVEEFVTGPIRHYDGLVQGGDVLVLRASEYIGTCLDYAQGSPMGSVQIPVSPSVLGWVARALAAVQITDGSFHLEAIVDAESGNGDLVFLEVGNRVGGADVVATFELATGIHLPSWELRILLGEPVDRALPAPRGDQRWFGWFVFPGHHLTGHEFRGLDATADLRSDPGVVTWHELPCGAELPDHITYQAGETVLAGIVTGGTPEAVRGWMTELFDTVVVRVRPVESLIRERVRV